MSATPAPLPTRTRKVPGHRSRFGRMISFLTIAAGLVVPLAAGAKPPKTSALQDSPLLALDLQEVGVDSPSLMTIWCDRTAPSEAECIFSQSRVTPPPSANETASMLAGFSGEKARAALGRELAKSGWKLDADYERLLAYLTASGSEPQKRWASLMRQALRQKDVDQVLASFRFLISEIKAHTCKITVHSARKATFRQRGPNLWESVNIVAAGGIAVTTLWRANKDSPWNFREALVGDGDCTADDLLCVRSRIAEFRWDVPSPATSCRYISG